MLKIACDYCEKVRPMRGVELFNAYPYPLFDGWQCINEKHLCDECSKALDEFLTAKEKSLKELRV